MLTLQNEPPSIDTSAESAEQYKNYGKIFRKMISECLKKEPEQRPTAKQLLKHEFFKKAKVRIYALSYLVQFPCRSMPVSYRVYLATCSFLFHLVTVTVLFFML